MTGLIGQVSIVMREFMSEYQYYEFQSVDRRLSDKEMQELRAYSTRAHITPTSFANEYSFGDFKGNPDAWMEKYFDAFLYVANWGTHEFKLGLPSKVLSVDTARLYCCGDAASVRKKADKLVFTFLSEEEGGGEWVQGEGILSSLLPLRAELARGDLRSLYIGWLLSAQIGELDQDMPEPPMPANLGTLSSALSSLVEFLRIDPDLLAAAAQNSPRTKSAPANRKAMAAWVASLPAKEKNDMLVRLMEDEDSRIGMELGSRFNRRQTARSPAAEGPRRRVADLLAAAGIEAGE
jgi:hypothetical protein